MRKYNKQLNANKLNSLDVIKIFEILKLSDELTQE